MKMHLTYNALKSQIGRKPYVSKEDVQQKMDIFLIGDRITQDQYNELLTQLDVA
ncbi:hypothetical protein MKY34_14460 [Sporosarcina sp. FSL K6-1522]|uniref:hypothetical protein n=1 Tax=Sporosarcina sp. FSL K6-1522 TaxID=2921554 RepID=UPI00315A6257